VKVTPAHDPNDYEVAQRCGLPMINIMNPDGTIHTGGGRFDGLSMSEARQQVVKAMDALGMLEKTEDRQIELKHSDRSKTPIEPYLADQWFVSMGQLAQSAIDAVETGQVKIYPERYTQGYIDWLSEKRDWPVGRQLWWGHQIPIWTRTYESPEEAQGAMKKILAMPEAAQGQVSASIEEPSVLHVCILEEASGMELKIQSLGLVRQEDVLDTWFSSALWPHSTLGWPDRTDDLNYFYPTNTLITSRDTPGRR